ncbi:StAR-related lipid transfer protein 3 [Sparganum proliferum]
MEDVDADNGGEFASPEMRTEAHQAIVDALQQTGQSSHDVVPDGKVDAHVMSTCPMATAPEEGVAGTHLYLALSVEPDLTECSGVHLVAPYPIFFAPNSARSPFQVFTTVSTVAVIIKCVMFDFGIASDSPLGLAYTILVYNIVMPWLVTVFFEYRVLPQERMAEQISKNLGRLNANVPNDLESVAYPSIHRWAAAVAASTYAASIYASPRGSIIDDEEPLLQTRKTTDYGSTEAPFDVAALLIQASKVCNDAWSAYESAPDFTPQTSSACLPGFKVKLFRVEGLIPAPSRMIFNDLVQGVEFSPHWNPTVASARYLQTFQGENLDIVHTMSKEVLGGLIKPRDFVLLRVWGESNGILYIASASVLHPKCPPRPECIRGEQIISAIMLQPSGSICRFVWISGIDLKGWLSNSLTERGLTVSMSTFFAAVLTRAESLCVNANPPRRSSLHTTHSSGLNETC